jgi:hypothetical protein
MALAKLTPWRQNPKVHQRIHKSLPPVPILSQLDPIYTPPANLPKFHSDPILPSTPWSKWSLSFWLSHQNPLLSHACHMSHPPHSPLFDLPNNIWGGVQNMKLLIVQLSPFTCYFIPLWCKSSNGATAQNRTLASSRFHNNKVLRCEVVSLTTNRR